MQKFLFKTGATFASVTLVASLVAPAALAADLEISGNGDGSTNIIKVTVDNTTDVEQLAFTKVEVNATATADSGNNSADGNVVSGGGSVDIDTGKADATNSGGDVVGSTNIAVVSNCCECECNSVPSALIFGNGQLSFNKIKYKKFNTTLVFQLAKTKVKLNPVATSNSGGNTTDGNVVSGGGSVDNTTDNATADNTGGSVLGSLNSYGL